MDRGRAETCLRQLAEAELHRATAPGALGRGHADRLPLVAQALIAAGTVNVGTADQIQAELDLALAAVPGSRRDTPAAGEAAGVRLPRAVTETLTTVGSAYVGSNPTPATTCVNGPLAAETRPGGPFPSRHAVYQCVSLRSMCCGVHGRKRTASGPPGRSVRTVGFSRTATDRVRGVPISASPAALSRLLAQGRECRGCLVCREGSGGLAFRSAARGGTWAGGWISGNSRARVTQAAGVVWAVRPRCGTHGGTACGLPFRGRGGPLWRASRRAWHTDGHGRSALAGCVPLQNCVLGM
jgi:hypothetical protein